MRWRTRCACCRSSTATTRRLPDRGLANAPMLSQIGPRISKSRTYLPGCNTPEGDEESNRSRAPRRSNKLLTFNDTIVVPESITFHLLSTSVYYTLPIYLRSITTP